MNAKFATKIYVRQVTWPAFHPESIAAHVCCTHAGGPAGNLFFFIFVFHRHAPSHRIPTPPSRAARYCRKPARVVVRFVRAWKWTREETGYVKFDRPIVVLSICYSHLWLHEVLKLAVFVTNDLSQTVCFQNYEAKPPKHGNFEFIQYT